MAVLVECLCHKKQSLRNRVCSCGEDLVKVKRANRVNYWIAYHVGNRLKWERVGRSIEEAKDAHGKRQGQKRENRIFDIKPESKMTFKELASWYLGLEKVKGLKYYPTKKILLNKFNSELGNKVVGEIKPVDLENLQAKRKKEGMADASIDAEIGEARTMINKSFDNEPVEKVTFLKTASSAGLKIENYFLPSKVFAILGEMFVFS